MIRTYEKEVSWKAGALAIGVHLALLGALLISFNWKAAHPVLNIAGVELWDSLPNNAAQKPEPIVEPVVKEQPEPIIKETPKPDQCWKISQKKSLKLTLRSKKRKK